MESDARFFRRRAREELAAAKRAVTPAARDRRMHLANIFFQRLEAAEVSDSFADCKVSPTAKCEATENSCTEDHVRENA